MEIADCIFNFKNVFIGVIVVQQVTNLTNIHDDAGSIPLTRWVKDPGTATSCSVGHRQSSNPELAVLKQAPAWELPCAVGVVLKRNKQKTKTSNGDLLFTIWR